MDKHRESIIEDSAHPAASKKQTNRQMFLQITNKQQYRDLQQGGGSENDAGPDNQSMQIARNKQGRDCDRGDVRGLQQCERRDHAPPIPAVQLHEQSQAAGSIVGDGGAASMQQQQRGGDVHQADARQQEERRGGSGGAGGEHCKGRADHPREGHDRAGADDPRRRSMPLAAPALVRTWPASTKSTFSSTSMPGYCSWSTCV